MNNSRKFLYNSFSTAIYQVIVVIAGFITPRVMLTHYGSEINGLVTSITQFISYFNLIEAGIAQSSMLSLYKPLAEKNYTRINRIIVAAKKYYNKTGYIYISAIIVLSLLYPTFIKTNSAEPIYISLLITAIGLSGALEFFIMAKYRVLLEADQKTYVISITNTISILINTLIVVIMAMMEANIVILKFVSLFSVLSRSIIFYVYTKHRYKYIDYSVYPDNTALSKRWDALYMQLMNSIYHGAPTVLVTIFLDLKSVSIYSIYNMVTHALHSAFYVITTGLTASFGQLIATNQIDKLRKVYNYFQYVFFSVITLSYSIAFVVYLPFISLYTSGVGDVNYILTEYAVLFATRGLLQSIKTPLRMLINASGMYRETRIQTTLESLITVSGGIILIPFFGLSGIIIGSIIADLYRCIDLIFFVSKKITKEKVSIYGYRIIRIFICVIFVYLISINIGYNPTNYLNWALYSTILGIISIIFQLLLGLLFERQCIKWIFNQLLKVVNKVFNKHFDAKS